MDSPGLTVGPGVASPDEARGGATEGTGDNPETGGRVGVGMDVGIGNVGIGNVGIGRLGIGRVGVGVRTGVGVGVGAGVGVGVGLGVAVGVGVGVGLGVGVGVESRGATVIETVAALSEGSPSTARYVKVSTPLNPPSGWYVKPPLAAKVRFPWVGLLTSWAVRFVPSKSVSFASTPGAGTTNVVCAGVP